MKLKNKILKNLVNIGLPAFILGFGLNYFLMKSNNSSEELEKTLKNKILEEASKLMTEHLEKLNNYKPLEKREIDSAFSFLNPGLREHLKKAYFIKKEDLFCKNSSAEAHLEGIICLTDSSKETIFHESAHIRKNALDMVGSDFSKKWNQIANFEYGDENTKSLFNEEGALLDRAWKDDLTGCPKNGVLNPYSSKSIGEDVAIFVESLEYVNKK